MASLRWSALILLAIPSAAAAQDASRSAVAAWDTGVESAQPLALEGAEPQSSWKKAEGLPKGDLVVTNGRLLAVARRRSSGLELYSLRSGKPVYRSRLQLAPSPVEKVELTEA